MCSKVLNGHIILTDTSITTILAPEMTYTPKYFGDEGTPEAVVTFTPDKVIEIAEALLGFARVAHKQDGRV